MSRISCVSGNGKPGVLQIAVEVRERRLVEYFEQFAEPERSAKALEAIRVGVIALQTASPTLDTQIVKDQFAEMQQEFGEALALYFADKDGVVPKSLNLAFGEKGALSQFFQRHFDPESGKLIRLMEGQIGPSSKFGKLFNPDNKAGVIATIEEKVKQIVEAKLDEVLNEFCLDDENSAISHLKATLESAFVDLRQAMGIRAAVAAEAERGHVKGLSFEEDLYEVVAVMGRQFGDATELVRGTRGAGNCKIGDHLITLGETTGAPGLCIVVEAKDQEYKLKKAIAELQEAKKNREAVSGIFIFAKGCEPPEIGNFRRIDNDFYCTADKAAMAEGGPLPYVWAAYELARAQAIAAVRKEAAGKLDLERIQQHIDGIATWVPRLGEIVTKARTVKNHGDAIETTANDIKKDIETRVAEVLALLRVDAE
jgi:hypothetical protein